MTTRLTIRAALLLADERILSGIGANDGDGPADEPISFPEQPPLLPADVMARADRPLLQMVTPPLIALVAYLQRSATIAYRRETGLANFSWQVLSLIGEKPSATLAELIAVTSRDKSQVGRTVRRLEEAGNVVRRSRRGRRDVVLSTTARGATLYAEMCIDALRRDAFLFAEESPADRIVYFTALDTMTANARNLLESERASAAEQPVIDAARVDGATGDARQLEVAIGRDRDGAGPPAGGDDA
jgi:DNA-binding MarR family transcriptional regulator